MRPKLLRFKRVPDHRQLVERLDRAACATVQSNVPPRPYYIVVRNTPKKLIIVPFDGPTMPLEFWWGTLVTRDELITALKLNGNLKLPADSRREIHFVEYEDALAVRSNWVGDRLNHVKRKELP